MKKQKNRQLLKIENGGDENETNPPKDNGFCRNKSNSWKP